MAIPTYPDARKRCFEPVVDERTRVLVLGSLPGDRSLARQEYYGHPQNQFWRLVGAILGLDLRAADYASRLATLRDHGIGLWDVIAEAERPGSLDAAISHATHNAVADLAQALPQLRAIAFNGATAARLGRKQLGAGAGQLCLVDLPSSSAAHTIGFEAKLHEWSEIARYL